MPLAPGARIGAYEILSALGAGGMGEVYRAKDTRLGREIALKILPASFTSDPERIARFRREAQVLASLNHPHIGAIYGLDETNGTQFLVLELVDGESLDRRLARGAIALDEALRIARQIAEALEAAHEKGIVHRDLKPANIALTRDGAVKLLDFGLAKAVETTTGSFDLTNSPTITSPAMMTAAGVILGTAPYMSPEQAKGRAADKRADIWAFGCVLYEMLAGERAFRGDDVSDALANVLKGEPAWDALPRQTPTSVRHLLRRCLSKDPSRRLRDIGDARLELTDAAGESDSAPSADDRRRGTWLAAIVASAVAGTVAGVFASFLLNRSVPVTTVTRWTVSLPADAPVDLRGPWSSLAISRDGRSILYVAQTNNGRELFLRRADDLSAHVVGGTAGVWEAFFSPDGDWIGFIAADRLKKVAVTGGQPVTIGDAANFNSGVWADDGTIYLGGRAGLARMSAEGRLTQLVNPASDEGRLSHPDLLPDGSLLFTIEPNDVTSFDDARIAVVTPKGDRRVVLEGGAYARYSPTGHILYVRGGEIMAAPFDARRLTVTGRPAGVIAGGSFDVAAGAAYFAVSRTGVLVYVPGGPLIKQRSLAWSDRHGGLTPIPAPRRFYAEPSISPDQRQIAFTLRAANDDIWTFDVARGSFARLTFPHGNNEVPTWSPDGRRIVYAVDRDGVRRLFWRPADGSGSEEALTPAEYFQTTGGWSPDGQLLAYTEDRPKTGSDIFILPVDSGRTPVPFLTAPVNERSPVFSPDGHWIAYASDETGRFEIFVTPYPGPGRKWQVSGNGGIAPAWRRDGREIVYLNDDQVMSVAIDTAPTLRLDRPAALFKLPPYTDYYGMAADGQRFVVVYGDGSDRTARELDVVLNWFEELKARVAVK